MIRIEGKEVARLAPEEGRVTVELEHEDLIKQISTQGLTLYGRTLTEIKHIIDQFDTP